VRLVAVTVLALLNEVHEGSGPLRPRSSCDLHWSGSTLRMAPAGFHIPACVPTLWTKSDGSSGRWATGCHPEGLRRRSPVPLQQACIESSPPVAATQAKAAWARQFWTIRNRRPLSQPSEQQLLNRPQLPTRPSLVGCPMLDEVLPVLHHGVSKCHCVCD
jgi:hypothetical protein